MQGNEKKKSRLAVFAENMLAYGITTALAKMIPLIMLPIITSLLTDSADYGRYDMYNTIVEFGQNIAILGMYDAMFRQFFEKDDLDYKQSITSTAFNIVCISSMLVGTILILFNHIFSNLFFGNSNSGIIVIFSGISVLIMGIKTIVAAPIRMENRTRLYISISLVGSVAYYILAFIFVFSGFNYAGMIYANIIYAFGILIVQWYFTHKHFIFAKIDLLVAKELFRIGLPLLPTFLVYWIFHAMDKIMITNMMGLEAVGIYSVGAKVAQISQIVYTAFSIGWQYFAYSTMKDKDQVHLISKVMEYLSVLSFSLFILSTLFDDIVFKLIFTGDYVKGVTVFPFLFLSPLILMIFQVIGNQTIIYNKSYLNTISLFAGTIVNLILNYFFIKSIGIRGAAIATLCSYLVSLACMIGINLKHKWMVFPVKFGAILAITVIFTLLIVFLEGFITYIAAIISLSLIILIYNKEFRELINRILIK